MQMLTQEYMIVEHLHLRIKVGLGLLHSPFITLPLPAIGSMHQVKPGLAYCHYTRRHSQSSQPSEIVTRRKSRIPWVNPDRIQVAGKKAHILSRHSRRIDIDHGIPTESVGVVINHGTGS